MACRAEVPVGCCTQALYKAAISRWHEVRAQSKHIFKHTEKSLTGQPGLTVDIT